MTELKSSWFYLFSQIFIFLLFCSYALSTSDPCLDMKHIKIDDENRSTGVKWKFGSGQPMIEDTSLSEFWYRFVSNAGGYIPTSCPNRTLCGTLNTIWMNGKVPKSNETVSRQVCINDGGSCKSSCFNIDVKNCGDFAVYKLKPAPKPKTGYCAGDKVRCPNGTVSSTGFPPCGVVAKIPSNPNPPKLELELLTNTFRFKCALQNPGTGLKHFIKWFAGGNLIMSGELQPGKMDHYVWENQLHFRNNSVMGTHLRCEVSAKKPTVTIGTPWISSSKPGYFMGVEVIDENGAKLSEVTVDENDAAGKDLVNVYFRSTIPIKCNTDDYKRDASIGFACEVFLSQGVRNLASNKQELSGPGCGSKAQRAIANFAQQVKFGTCKVSLQDTSSNSYQKHPLRILAFRDNLIELHPETRYIDFKVEHEYQAIWKDYRPPSLKVTAVDTYKGRAATYCKSSSDPHITTFDGDHYHIQHEGEFVFYENTQYNFRVHIFMKKCGGGSCNCAVAAQAGDDVIIVDKCKTFGGITGYGRVPTLINDRSVLRLRAFTRTRQTDGFDFERHGDEHYVIRFPHGAEVKVKLESYGLDVFVTPSQLDRSTFGNSSKVRGLCGVFNGRSEDDFTLKNGKILPIRSSYENAFSKDWQIHASDSLYNGRPLNSSKSTGKKLCMCFKVNKKMGSGDGQRTICDFRTSCDKIVDLKQIVATRTGSRLKKSIEADHDYVTLIDDSDWGEFTYDDTPIDPAKLKWLNGWTETKAMAYCSRLLNNSATVKACRDVEGVNENEDFKMCVSDIQLTGGTDFALSAIDSVKAKCEEIVSTDKRLWNVSDDSSSFVLPRMEVLNNVCPRDCSNRGRCVEGQCICNSGYMSDDCSKRIDTPPEVFVIPQEGLCDTTIRPCRSTPVIGDGFIDNSNLTCHFQTVEVTEQGFRSTGEEHDTTPLFESYMELHCPLPAKHVRARRQDPVGTPAVGYNITISNNGKLRSVTSVNLLVYDSRCQACNSTTGLCTLKPNTCLIRGYCQLPGDMSETDACLTCDPDTSTSGWTKTDDCPSSEENSNSGFPMWGIVVICVAGGILIGIAIVSACRKASTKYKTKRPPTYEEEMRQRAQMNFQKPAPTPMYE